MARTKDNGVPVVFRFHGCLVELLDRSRRQGEYSASVSLRSSVKDAVESQGVPHVEVGMVAVNGVPCGWDRLLERNEQVDVWEIADLSTMPEGWRVDEADPDPPRFLLDVHLGRLAAYLRLLGYDTVYDAADPGDESLAQRAHAEGRILLTCDRGLLMRNPIRHGRLLRSRNSVEQTREIIQRYRLQEGAAPFTRCLRCNGLLVEAAIAKIRDRIPERVFRRHGLDASRYRICDQCGRLYWEGSHTQRMRKLLADWGIADQERGDIT